MHAWMHGTTQLWFQRAKLWFQRAKVHLGVCTPMPHKIYAYLCNNVHIYKYSHIPIRSHILVYVHLHPQSKYTLPMNVSGNWSRNPTFLHTLFPRWSRPITQLWPVSPDHFAMTAMECTVDDAVWCDLNLQFEPIKRWMMSLFWHSDHRGRMAGVRWYHSKGDAVDVDFKFMIRIRTYLFITLSCV